MATLYVELERGAPVTQVEGALRKFGISAVKRFQNISALFGSDVWLFDAPPGTPIEPLALIPGIQNLEITGDAIYLPDPDVGPFGTPFLSLGPIARAEQSALASIVESLGLAEARERTEGGEGMIIVIVDSGIDGTRVPPSRRVGGWTDHPDGDPWRDSLGHGTMVALMALAVAPAAKLFSCRMKQGPGAFDGMAKESLVQAFDDVLPILTSLAPEAKGFVLNHSFGLPGCVGESYWCNLLLVRGLEKLDRTNFASIVFSAGNSNAECAPLPTVFCSNSLKGNFAVAAVDAAGEPQPYSARGPGQCYVWSPFVAAPTYGVLPWAEGWRDFGELGAGTSSVAPLVSGALALIKASSPDVDNVALRAAVAASARGRLGLWDRAVGFGTIQVDRAVQMLPTIRTHPVSFLLSLPSVPPFGRGLPEAVVA